MKKISIRVVFLALCFACFFSSGAYAQDGTQHADSIDQANAKTVREDGQGFTKKATVAAKDSIIEIYARLGPGFKDYRIFGYAQPDTLSQRMILISLFTDDVKNNPFNCPFGAWYGTGKLKDDQNMQLKYLAPKGHFIEAAILKNYQKQATIYIQKKWIEFEEKDQ